MAYEIVHLPIGKGCNIGNENAEVCVVGVFGMSTWGHTSKGCIINQLTNTYEFPPHEPGDVEANLESGDESFSKFIPKIEVMHDEKNQIVYLHLVSMYDTATLASICTDVQSRLDSHSASHDMWKCYEVGHIFGLVYLFSICHMLMLVHPFSQFDISYDRLFQRIASLRTKLMPVIKDVLKDCNVGRDWWANGRPCPPRLLFIFQRCHLLEAPKKKDGDSKAVGEPGVVSSKKKKPPVKRLQHTIEDQVYRILRSSRVLTNNAVNCLFSVPPNQAFVHIMTDEFKKIEKEEDPILGMMNLLRDSSTRHRDPNAKSKAKQLLLSPPTHWMEDYMTDEERRKEDMKESGNSLRSFVFQHTSLVLDKKGFNDSIGRNPLPSHFELPTLKTWIKVANGLFHLLLVDGADLNQEPGAQGEVKKSDPESKIPDETAAKVINCRHILRSKIDIEMKFSEARCSKVLPMAIAAYQTSLPSHYTSKVHNNQLTQALLTYNQHARGPATEKYRNQLNAECLAFWRNGRQLCEVRSLTDRHCVHRYHILAQPNIPQDPDMDPPILFHSSRSRSTATSNCGTIQGMRDDPFNLKEANYDFYVQLDKKAPVQPIEVYAFPVYQPGDEPRPHTMIFTDGTASFSSQILSTENPQFQTSSTGIQHHSASITTQEDEQQQGQSGKPDEEKTRSRHVSEGIIESATEDTDNVVSTQDSADDAQIASGNLESSSQEFSQNDNIVTVSPRKSAATSPMKERADTEIGGAKASSKEISGQGIDLNFALSFGAHSEGSGLAEDSQREEMNMENANQQNASSQKPVLVKTDVKLLVNFIDGMIHSNCQKGVLPLYPSWSLVKIGSYSQYTPSRGMDTPGFLPGTSFLIPWDIPVEKPKDDVTQWPVPSEAQGSLGKKITLQRNKDQHKSVLGRRNKEDGSTMRVFIGLEYETLRGQRFICSGPDKPVKVTSSGIVKDSCHRLLESDMPLYTPSPVSGRSGKTLLGHLMRAYVVIPPEASFEISLNPQVIPGPPPTPTFTVGVPDISLGSDSIWVLRFPYVYVSDMGTHYIPKENVLLSTCKLLKGMFKLSKK